MLTLRYKILISLFTINLLIITPSFAYQDKIIEYQDKINEIESQEETATTKKEVVELSREKNEAMAYLQAFEKAIEHSQPTFVTSGFSYNSNHDLKYIDLYKQAGQAYNVDWTLLASVHEAETNFSTHPTMVSYAGALGHMQFMPGTWDYYGVDANGNGKADPFEIEDAIFSASHYLAKSGADKGDFERALWAYNRSTKYGQDVLARKAYFDNKYKEVASNEGTEETTSNESIGD